MEKSNLSALEPFGEAIYEYWQGDKSGTIIHELKSGEKKELPVSVFFRSGDNLLDTDHAFEFCFGRVLVVGGGTGVHAIELEKKGFEVTTIDVCPQAVEIMKKRGIKDVRQDDFFSFSGKLFDTILILGQNIGICRTLKGINGFLLRCNKLMNPGGQLILNSIDESISKNGNHRDKYPGELEFRLTYKGNTGPWMRWLHIDFKTLNGYAYKSGWSCEKLISNKEGGFLARLKLMNE